MDEELRRYVIAALRISGAQTAILRDVLRHLVEEDLLPPDKAARIVLNAANEDLPSEESTGETYDAAREELVLLATALLNWPGKHESDRAPRGNGPIRDVS